MLTTAALSLSKQGLFKLQIVYYIYFFFSLTLYLSSLLPNCSYVALQEMLVI